MLCYQHSITMSHCSLMVSIGPDRTWYCVQSTEEHDHVIDKIEEYWQARYLSAGEAVWRILGFHITKKDPAVTALPIHLPGSHVHHQYHQTRQEASTLSLLDRYFIRPLGSFINHLGFEHHFNDLTYAEYYRLFHLAKFEDHNTGRRAYFEEHAPLLPMYP